MQQANENVEPEVPGRSIQEHREERKVSALFSFADTTPRLFAARKREKAGRRGAKKRSRLMEKVRKQQENKQPGCSRRDAFALKCPKLRAHVFLLFLPFLARSSAKWTLRDTKRRLQNVFQRRKRFAQAPSSSLIIIAIMRLSIPIECRSAIR